MGRWTCKCTIGRLLRDEIAPGKSAKIHLQWKTLGTTDNFRQTAEILTNDPDRPRFGLILTGKIRTYLGIIPRQLVFDDASAHASATRTTSVYSQAMEQFEVTKVDSTSKYLSYEVTPLTQQSLESQRFMSGYQFAVTVEPGIPIGRFFERMTIHTDIKDVKPVELTIKGTMSGDVSIYGSDWNNEASYVNFGSVPRDEGASRELHLYGHGPYRDLQPEDFTIRTAPDFLKVHLTRDAELTGPKAPAHLILKLEVPADSPPVNYVGSKTNPLGEVMLEPNLPEDSGAVPINLGVKFNVQQ